jgi:sensor histidine kinase regulating citrate/malate metabolism
MSTVIEIESAVEKLSPQEAREFAAWFEQRQAMLNAAEATFLAYDEEEGKAS